MKKKIKVPPILIILIIALIYCSIYTIAYPIHYNHVTKHWQALKEREELLVEAKEKEKIKNENRQKQAEEKQEIDKKVKQRLENVEIGNEQYFEENSKFYTIKENKKLEIISPTKAKEIALEEAKNEKYKIENQEAPYIETATINLKPKLDYTSKRYFWNEEWQSDKYEDFKSENVFLWKVKLQEEGNETNKLFIYIDAQNGDILGAGSTEKGEIEEYGSYR